MSLPNISPNLARPDLLSGIALPPEPKQARSRHKRTALLTAAQTLFAQQGFESTTIQDIAQAAEVAVGGFYQHFLSKQHLLLVLMDQLVTDLEQFPLVLTPEQPIEAQLEALLRAGLQLDWAYRGVYRAWREVMLRDSHLRALNDQIEAWTTMRLWAAFEALSSFPNARQDLDRRMLAWTFNLLFWEFLLRMDDDHLESIVITLKHLMLHGLFHL
ncbi:MAG: TetR/AcrR family transcriptional regulator [Anaerolineae bacterium]|jgi:AcrR family transcriptional regulator|nr:TetR/AcrR family transcriptional regulator [Anaerolineae bacterium]